MLHVMLQLESQREIVRVFLSKTQEVRIYSDPIGPDVSPSTDFVYLSGDALFAPRLAKTASGLTGDFPGNPICQPFVNFTIGRMELHSGVKILRLKAKRLASIRLCRERCRVTKDVEHSARHCKAVEGAGSRFGQFPGRSSFG